VVFKDKLLLFGGVPEGIFTYANNVWESEDGVSWIKVTASSPIPTIVDAKRLLVFDDRLWLLSAGVASGAAWYSDDGKEWVQAYSAEEFFFERSDYSATVFNGKIWIIAGQINAIRHNDVWVLN